jgi:DNA-binding beta-propeller fold protein YncE
MKVERTHTVCAGRELANGLALESSPAGTVAYVASWGWHDGSGGAGPAWSGRGGRIMALNARTGAILTSVHLPGAPGALILAPAPDGIGQRLYCVDATPGPESEQAVAGGWRLLGLNPATLEVESTLSITYLPRRFAAAPDGNHLYGLNDGGTGVMHHDLATGQQRRLARVRGDGVSLVVTAERVYVPNAHGGEVWAIDRRSGRVEAIAVGRRPTKIVVGNAGAAVPSR